MKNVVPNRYRIMAILIKELSYSFQVGIFQKETSEEKRCNREHISPGFSASRLSPRENRPDYSLTVMRLDDMNEKRIRREESLDSGRRRLLLASLLSR